MKKACALILAYGLCLVNCTAHLKPLSPSYIYQPKAGHGILLTRVVTNTPLSAFRLDGPITGKITEEDLNNGQFILLQLPSGLYTLSRAEWQHCKYADVCGLAYINMETTEYLKWDFDIHPDQINYIGDFIFETSPADENVLALMTNRSSYALQHMQEEFPEVLAKLPIRYAGLGEDHFFRAALRPVRKPE